MLRVTRPSGEVDLSSAPVAHHAWPWWQWAALITLAFALSLVRAVPGSQRFTMGSEDAAIFTQQVGALGVWHSLVTIYAGYFTMIPRTVAAIASMLPLDWIPLARRPEHREGLAAPPRLLSVATGATAPNAWTP